MRLRSSAALAALSLPLIAGCPDQGRHSALRLESVPVCGGDRPTLGCVEVRVCESDHPSTCVSVAPVGGPYPMPEEPGQTLLVVPIVGGVLRFDVRAAVGTTYDVDVLAFSEATSRVIAAGHANNVTLGGETTVLQLYPTDGWACPTVSDTEMVLRRAFHQTVALSNGDALLIGGITFERSATGLSLIAGTPTAGLVDAEHSVLVWDAHDQQLYPVTITGGDGAGLARVMFDARWVERTVPDGRERVRLFGGVTGTSSLTFASSSTSQYPVHVSDGAELANVLDILYDPATRSMEIVERDTPLPSVVESLREPLPTDGVDSFAALVGPSSGPAETVTSFGTASDSISAGAALPSARRGATLTGLGARGFIVYGGNVADMGAAQDTGRALVLSPSGTLLPVTLPASLAISALHTASVIDSDTVLFVGGLGLTGASVGPATGPVVRAYELASSGSALTEVAITGAETSERIYHTATTYRAPDAARSSVVVVGGSTRTSSQLQPLDSAYVVDLDASPPIRALPSLRVPRLGHAAVLLRGGTVLVTGGLRRGDPPPMCTGMSCERTSSLYLVEEIEILAVRPPHAALSCAEAGADAGVSTPDAAARPDAATASDAGATSDAASAGDGG
ncbi:MAG: hypothetical protein K1X94_28545 [Sandaracinaceae bacterium]|nr:hypothetical protein [Sandaracinaceae bacterium]